MALQNYIDKLRAKPQRERERIAVIATGVSFAIIFLIWIVSFNEMNKPAQSETESQPGQLEDLKSNLGSGRASIEEMFRELPQGGNLEENNNDAGGDIQDMPSESNNAKNDGSILNNLDDESGGEIPQLP